MSGPSAPQKPILSSYTEVKLQYSIARPNVTHASILEHQVYCEQYLQITFLPEVQYLQIVTFFNLTKRFFPDSLLRKV